jgi:DNA mismatch repair ATPase MutL
MKFALGITLGLAIALSQVLVAQEPAPDKQKPKPEEPAPKAPEPDNRQPQASPKTNPQQQPEKQEKDQQKADKKQEKEQEKQSKDEAKKGTEKTTAQQPAQKTQQNKTQASNAKGQRIPPQKFQSSFGSQHQFRVRHLEEGRRFQYSGYWFEMVEVWPAGWSYDDECYIDEDGNDYYLVDAFHPDTRVMVIVVET